MPNYPRKSNAQAEHLTVMFLDLCRYTHISSKLNRETLHELHELFDSISIPAIELNQGTIVKKIGDAFLATFRSPTNALHCAIELQNKFKEYDKINQPRYPLHIKIALHSGEVITRGGDIYGDAVNIASRIEGIVKENQILFSGSLFSAMNKNEIHAVYLGRRRFKGVQFPVRIYKVIPRKSMRKGYSSSSLFKNLLWWLLVLAIVYLLIKVGEKLI